MKTLTDKQKRMLDFIEEFQARESMAPTVYEIAEHFGIKTSTVFAHLKALQRKDQLSRTSKARSISLKSNVRKNANTAGACAVPLLRFNGEALHADKTEQKVGDVVVSPELVTRAGDSNRLFAIRVVGDSMHEQGIFEGDVVIVKPTETLRSGDIVVAIVGGELTIKSYFPQKDNKVELRPANSEYSTQVYLTDEVEVQGKIIGLMREY